MAAKMIAVLLIVLVAITGVAAVEEAAAPSAPSLTPVELSPATKKSVDDLDLKLKKVVDTVVATAPPAKQSEARETAMVQSTAAQFAIGVARSTGDEKKVVAMVGFTNVAVDEVLAAPPAQKLQVFEEAFKKVEATFQATIVPFIPIVPLRPGVPDPRQCPAVNKPFCETYGKVLKANFEATAAAPKGKDEIESHGDIMKQFTYPAIVAINEAYEKGDEKKIARVLAAYSKAADAVLAAPPAEKLKAMQEAFPPADAEASRPGA